MATPRARAAFKKKDGIIAISDAQDALTWTPLPGTGSPTVSLPISNITSETNPAWTSSQSPAPATARTVSLCLLTQVAQICNRPQIRTQR